MKITLLVYDSLIFKMYISVKNICRGIIENILFQF